MFSIEVFVFLLSLFSHFTAVDGRGPRLIRFTVNYVPCKERYIINGKEVFGCNSEKTPAGKDPLMPWCYLNDQFFKKGDPIWDYCYDDLDYDEIRYYYGGIREMEIDYWKNLESKAQELLAEVTKTLTKIEKTKKGLAKKDETISNIETTLATYKQIIENLRSQKEGLINNDKNLKRTEFIMKSKDPGVSPKIDPFNCSAYDGYENKMIGDGLHANFFPNDRFEGQTVDKEIEIVKFFWSSEDPITSIHFEDFSLHIKGWLRVPVTSRYVFRIESEESFAMFINKQPIISHYIGLNATIHGGKEPLTLIRDTLMFRKSPVWQPQMIGYADSFEIHLSAQNLYEIEVFYYRSLPDKLYIKDTAILKLLWKNEFQDFRIIDTRFLFKKFVFQPLRADKSPESLTLPKCILEPNTQAYIDTEEYILVDVPFKYSGYECVRKKEKEEDATINVPLSVQSVLYIAIDIEFEINIPDGFDYTQEFLTIRRKDGSSNKRFQIYTQKFTAFNVTVILKKVSPILVFFTKNPESSPFSCGGADIELSSATSKAFDKCKFSSKMPGAGFGCLDAFSGKLVDDEKSVWASDKSVGSFIELNMKSDFQINLVEMKNRDDPADRVKAMELWFGPGNERKIIFLENNPLVQKFPIDPPVITNFIRFTIKDVGIMRNNGASIKVTGNGCMKKHEIQMEFKQINLTCADNFVNRYDFMKMKLKEKMVFSFQCTEQCKISTRTIFGDKTAYSYDSSICKAAVHAGALPFGIGFITVTLTEGKGYYPSATEKNIKSIAKGPSPFSFKVGVLDVDIMAPVTKLKLVDIKDDLEGQWKTGKLLKKADKKGQITMEVEILLRDESKRKEIVVWPNPTKVLFCGEKVSDAPCTPSDLSMDGPLFIDLRINFGPPSSKVPGYLQDTGQEYTVIKNYQYGWTRDMRDMNRKRYKNPDPVMDSLVLFNPDGNSMWCNKMKAFSSCEQADWQIKVTNGKYFVTVVLGDAKYKAKYDLQINGETFVSRVLEIGEFVYPQFKLLVANEFIKLSSRCSHQCSYSWTRINSIRIQKLDCCNCNEIRQSSSTF